MKRNKMTLNRQKQMGRDKFRTDETKRESTRKNSMRREKEEWKRLKVKK